MANLQEQMDLLEQNNQTRIDESTSPEKQLATEESIEENQPAIIDNTIDKVTETTKTVLDNTADKPEEILPEEFKTKTEEFVDNGIDTATDAYNTYKTNSGNAGLTFTDWLIDKGKDHFDSIFAGAVYAVVWGGGAGEIGVGKAKLKNAPFIGKILRPLSAVYNKLPAHVKAAMFVSTLNRAGALGLVEGSAQSILKNAASILGEDSEVYKYLANKSPEEFKKLEDVNVQAAIGDILVSVFTDKEYQWKLGRDTALSLAGAVLGSPLGPWGSAAGAIALPWLVNTTPTGEEILEGETNKRKLTGETFEDEFAQTLPGRQFGGPVEPGQGYQVGETQPEEVVYDDGSSEIVGTEGPEFFSPDQPGFVLPTTRAPMNYASGADDNPSFLRENTLTSRISYAKRVLDSL